MAKLYFYYSAMNAGKTTTLLQSAHNYRERGMRVAILTPRLDDRAGAGTVASRIGLRADAATGLVPHEPAQLGVHALLRHRVAITRVIARPDLAHLLPLLGGQLVPDPLAQA